MLPMFVLWLFFLFLSAYPPLLSLIPLGLPTAGMLMLLARSVRQPPAAATA